MRLENRMIPTLLVVAFINDIFAEHLDTTLEFRSICLVATENGGVHSVVASKAMVFVVWSLEIGIRGDQIRRRRRTWNHPHIPLPRRCREMHVEHLVSSFFDAES